MTDLARDYTPLRDLPLPSRPKTAAQILEQAANRAQAAGDIVAAYKLRTEALKATIAAVRQ
jgi:hypothetical protein